MRASIETFSSSCARLRRFITLSLTNTNSFCLYLKPLFGLFKSQSPCEARLVSRVISLNWISERMYELHLKVNPRAFRNFQAGQFIAVDAVINGRLHTRYFSISSSPGQLKVRGVLSLIISSQQQGVVTSYFARNLKKGDKLFISKPQGEFKLRENTKKKLFIAAGSGISPIFSMLSRLADKYSLQGSELIYYTSQKARHVFEKEFARLKNLGLRVTVMTTGVNGHLCADHLLIPSRDIAFKDTYLCGPGKMISDARALLRQAGANAQRIFSEFFTFSSLPSATGSDSNLAANSVSLDVSSRQIAIEGDNKTLLEVIEEAGISVLSGCRAGVCRQCVCKKNKGQVFDLKSQTYSTDEEQTIQLCQSVAVGHVSLDL